ncbi:hypothetical protein H310_12870 [Aphanomyces invadans]|uniref:Uncharacterized protein n=1 Tax=Aphanomyces invadans TaxID=157072 RepID=A0A024THK3_9STRA|nr:hypothetical protein H310_12870 [Aphanomyces invadans]ETV93071.1 hypothetical protein H310_12870 [Aphanomyces invadans]|eukprot:XP_008878336.1 hypothetical protein H310_12870 [Aphanomyces invadans]
MHQQAPGDPPPPSKQQHPQALRDLVVSNYSQGVSLGKIAKKLNLSKATVQSIMCRTAPTDFPGRDPIDMFEDLVDVAWFHTSPIVLDSSTQYWFVAFANTER